MRIRNMIAAVIWVLGMLVILWTAKHAQMPKQYQKKVAPASHVSVSDMLALGNDGIPNWINVVWEIGKGERDFSGRLIR